MGSKENRLDRDHVISNWDLPQQEVSQIDKLAVHGIFDVDYTPAVFATTNWLAINDDIALRSDNSERNHAL